MVGTGVFTTSGLLLANIGSVPWVLALWAVGGVVALCGALTYAELSAALPESGGDYFLLGRIYHPLLGFVAGWVTLVVGFAAPVAATALAFGRYLHPVVPWGAPLGWGAAVILVMTAIHAHDVRGAARAQDWVTLPKLLLLGALALAGLAWGNLGHLGWSRAPAGGLSSSLAVGLVYVYYAFSGWNGAVYVAGEVASPATTLPRALTLGTVMVTVLYLALNAAFFSAAPPEALSGVVEVGAVAASHLLGPTGGKVVSGLIALGLISAVGAMVMSGPRVYAAMGEDYRALHWLSRRTASGAPRNAVVVQTVLSLLMMAFLDIDDIFAYAGITLSISSALTVAGVLVLRWREPGLHRPYRTLGYPLTPLIFLAVMGWMVTLALQASVVVAYWSGGTLAIGAVLYWVVRPTRVSRG